ncbi:hypothetical protein CspHIS471_0401910 [Cutaneotrichosporon sp. HIS471]|nr:hypothetical protein CspHIS471_0401910 [Cutaneotrichosporon sp. HIS471]
MKYLLEFLDGVNDAPRLTDPDFQQLVVNVNAGKGKSSDAFYDALEKMVNELKASPEAAPFLKPVSKRDAPDYSQYISKPMDLQTLLRNAKNHKYKNKKDFANDVDLIWQNCLTYNTTMNHPLRGVALYLRQKSNHLLTFIGDRDSNANNPLAQMLAASGASLAVQRAASQQPPNDEEDAAGESDDAMGEDEESGKKKTEGPNGTAALGAKRATSVGSGDRRVNGKMHSSPPFRPNLQVNWDSSTALLRTPYTMTHWDEVSLLWPGPSFSDKDKAKELLHGNQPPPWYPAIVDAEDEDAKLEGCWWGAVAKDDAYVAGLPASPAMVIGPTSKRRRVARRRSPTPNGDIEMSETQPPALVPSKPVSLARVVDRAIDKITDARKTMHTIQELQRYYEGDGTDPEPQPLEPLESVRSGLTKQRKELKRKRMETRTEGETRRKSGGEVGGTQAVLEMKRSTASLLAHAGFDGANDIPLDLMTRVAGDYIRNLGRTFRLLLDFKRNMKPEELVLHVLHENGQVQIQDLETHIKDDIERDSAKISEQQRKMRAAYAELTTAPVIEDDMLLADDGQMLQHGDFAEDLGEDFLGLRELGIDKEFGLSSLSVPKSLFFGRRKRDAAALGPKIAEPDYAAAPPFIPLTAGTYKAATPALLHAFYAQRFESAPPEGDDVFDPVHANIGPLGQIVVKAPQNAPTKKKKDDDTKEKKPAKKTGQPGVGKGNWIRPSKEERERRAAEKKAELERQRAAEAATAEGDEEDAEGEEDE